MSLAVEVHVTGLDGVEALLARLSPLDTGTLLEGLARLVQQQTRRRIEEEKTAPDGTAWPKNKSGTPILYREGNLSRSIDYAVIGESIVVGSGLIYARPHQYGATIKPKNAKRLAFRLGNALVFAMQAVLPARPFLGLSAENARDILETTADFIRRKLG
jgi:phage gpG-like protein